MATAWRSKWLDWQPGNQIFQKATESELTKLTEPTFVSFVSAIQGNVEIISMAADDPDAWREPFRVWMTTACARSHRCFGGIGFLHVHFCEWTVAFSTVAPCTRQTFEHLLTDAGFIIADGLVQGLLLREDMEAAMLRTASKTG